MGKGGGRMPIIYSSCDLRSSPGMLLLATNPLLSLMSAEALAKKRNRFSHINENGCNIVQFMKISYNFGPFTLDSGDVPINCLILRPAECT